MLYNPERLRAVMKKQGRSVNWLSEVTGYDPSTISRILNGSQPMTEAFSAKVSDWLGIPVDWLRDESPIKSEVAVPA